MGILLALTGIAAAAIGSGAIYMRRSMASQWIDVRSDETNLCGKTVIITGANVGLGYETALDLAKRDAHVVIGCRDMQKGQRAAQSIQQATGKEETVAECLELDLANLSSVRTFVSAVKQKYKNDIYAVILNAGVCIPMDQSRKTNNDLEIHFGVNHLGHFELVNQLKDDLPHHSRVIFVASTMAKKGRVDFDSQDFVNDGRQVTTEGEKQSAPAGYCDSKLMNILCCKHLATQLSPTVATYSVCPGFCRSSLDRYFSFSLFSKLAMVPLMRLMQRTTVQGAQSIVFLVICDRNELENGAFYRDGKVNIELRDYVDSLGADVPKKLWDLSEKIADEIQ